MSDATHNQYPHSGVTVEPYEIGDGNLGEIYRYGDRDYVRAMQFGRAFGMEWSGREDLVPMLGDVVPLLGDAPQPRGALRTVDGLYKNSTAADVLGLASSQGDQVRLLRLEYPDTTFVWTSPEASLSRRQIVAGVATAVIIRRAFDPAFMIEMMQKTGSPKVSEIAEGLVAELGSNLLAAYKEG